MSLYLIIQTIQTQLTIIQQHQLTTLTRLTLLETVHKTQHVIQHQTVHVAATLRKTQQTITKLKIIATTVTPPQVTVPLITRLETI